MVLAIGLSRKTCLPASAAARVVSRCTPFGVVLMIPSTLLSRRISSYDAAGLQPYLAANFCLFSSERVKQETIVSFPDRLIALARTSDHQPIPRQATLMLPWRRSTPPPRARPARRIPSCRRQRRLRRYIRRRR